MKTETLNKANQIVADIAKLNAHIENVERVLQSNKEYSVGSPFRLAIEYAKSQNSVCLAGNYLAMSAEMIVTLYLDAIRKDIAAKQAELDAL